MLNDFVTDIVSYKTGNLLEFPENEILFNPFMVQRIVSMYSPEICHVVNETTNRKLSNISKKNVYKLLINIIPRQRRSFTKYFKKEKQDIALTDKDKKNIDFLCKKHKVSQREVNAYVKNFNLNLSII